MRTRSESAKVDIRQGEEYPYHGEAPIDWAERAALGILVDLQGRGGIKHMFGQVAHENRFDIVEAMAAIIREANPSDVAKEIARQQDMLIAGVRERVEDFLATLPGGEETE